MYRTDAPYHTNRERPRQREYRERRPINENRKPDNFVAKWRSAMTLAISNVFDRDQIELRSFSYPKYEVDRGVKADKMWCRQWYFHTLSDFGSFIDALNEAADKIEADKLLANPMPEIKPGDEVPFMDHGDRRLEFKIVKKWRSIMSVVIADKTAASTISATPASILIMEAKMQIPEHIVDLADKFVKKATGQSNRRKTKFLIADHIGFIESLGGKVIWPQPPAEQSQNEQKT